MKYRLIQAAEDSFTHLKDIAQRHPKQFTAGVAALLLGGAGASFAVASLEAQENTPPAAQILIEDVTTLPITATTATTARSNSNALQPQSIRLYRSDTSRSNDTAESLLKRLGVVDPLAAAFLRSDKLVQQTLMGRLGRNVSVEATERHALQKLTVRWSPEDDGMFKRLTVEKTPAGFKSRLETLPMNVSSRLASGTIHSSLFAATDDARMPDSIAVQLADIFAADIDFHRGLRKGDHFSVVYETLEGDGEPLRAGRVLSAEFFSAGKNHQAMWFQEPANSANKTAAPKGAYYTLAGESLRKAFLASPMEFSRVTSGFKMRFHPIFQTWRAHLGTDYAAPIGTPVRSVSDGIVEFSGVQNGFGNVVIVKHRNNNTTLYAHLSRINVRKGQSISQGQNIGAVGQTGWATGPHLHFEFRVNGMHQDPLTVARRNESLPVASWARPAFNQAATQVKMQLAAAAQMLPGSAQ
ncbi:MAG: M23 family metallopeptidase [Rhodoferax sp.]|nr:M23 family metallopeptidase [Rhodoferax sp.]